MKLRTRPLARLLLGILPLTAILASSPLPVNASGHPATLPGLTLSASPGLVDVGDQVQFTLRARQWPKFASVTIGFLSPHHGFSGKMPYRAACACFQTSVILARRVHPLETARAVAKVSYDHTMAPIATGFQIRGLAKNGRDFSPGGAVYLSGWVSDAQPLPQEKQHFCAWVKTADLLGVPGYPVTFVAHYQKHTETFRAGPTDRRGVACSQRSIGNAAPGKRVFVDIYAAGKHVVATFTPSR